MTVGAARAAAAGSTSENRIYMSLLNIFSLCGGLAFFLYGMHVMSHGLQKMAGGRLEKTLRSITANPLRGIALGALITIAIQSSSAMTVMLIGFVNSGMLATAQTLPIIMGSNIGTTLTTWLLSLTAISSENLFMTLLKPEAFAPVAALVSMGVIMAAKSSRKKDIAATVMGFAVLMTGMTQMSAAVSPLAHEPWFGTVMTMFSNPVLGVLAGTLLTALIQSSAASIGILQAISLTGGLTVGTALPLIMGANIGTCITAVLSAIGTKPAAQRVAAAHTYIKILSTLICLPVVYAINLATGGAFGEKAISPIGIAVFHSLYNIVMSLILLPFCKLIVRLTELTIRSGDEDERRVDVMLDDRLLVTPAFAVSESGNMTDEMARLSQQAVMDAVSLISGWSQERYERVIDSEDTIDGYEDKLGTYLVKISSRELTKKDSDRVTLLLHTISDFERISDHARNIAEACNEMREKRIEFSDEAKSDLAVLSNAARDILGIAVNSFISGDIASARRVEPLEEVITDLREQIKDGHIERLKAGQCTIEMGFVLSDLLGNMERVAAHCSNIAVCMIELQESSLNAHSYSSEVKSASEEYAGEVRRFREKYRLGSNA